MTDEPVLRGTQDQPPRNPAMDLFKTNRIRCMDCGRDTGTRGLGEYPLMLRDDVWLSITGETLGAGVLCRADMEKRLGRRLTKADLR